MQTRCPHRSAERRELRRRLDADSAAVLAWLWAHASLWLEPEEAGRLRTTMDGSAGKAS